MNSSLCLTMCLTFQKKIANSDHSDSETLDNFTDRGIHLVPKKTPRYFFLNSSVKSERI